MTRYSFVLSALMASATAAESAAYAQCGGNGWTGAVTCVSGYHCQYQNDWYFQCVPGAVAGPTKAAAGTTKAADGTTKAAVPVKTAIAATTLVTVHRSSSKFQY